MIGGSSYLKIRLFGKGRNGTGVDDRVTLSIKNCVSLVKRAAGEITKGCKPLIDVYHTAQPVGYSIATDGEDVRDMMM